MAVQADSSRIQWKSNKHFYQRFDQQVSWGTAQSNCQAIGAHLVTLTSGIERGFIYTEISSGNFWIGANDVPVDGRFTWVTGEKWVDEKWYWAGSGDYVYSNSNGFGLSSAGSTKIYICEWSANNYVGLVNVPDLNKNGSPEIAALYVDYITSKHVVKIRDPKTDKVINTLYFKSGFTQPPQGLVVIKDINGNRVPEIGVLYTEFGQPSVGIKDAKNDKVYINTLRFLDTNYSPKEISVYPDGNGNGYNDITVLGIRKLNNAPKAETRDSKTGKLLNDTQF